MEVVHNVCQAQGQEQVYGNTQIRANLPVAHGFTSDEAHAAAAQTLVDTSARPTLRFPEQLGPLNGRI